jgi:hypothetical protein
MSVATAESTVDQYGYALATRSDEAAAAWRTAIDRVGTYVGGVRPALEAAQAADPTFALPHGLESYLRRAVGDQAGSVAALARARRNAENATERERGLLKLLAQSGEGLHERTASLGEVHVTRFPVDRLAVGLTMNSLVSQADGHRRADAFLGRVARSWPADDWWMLSHRAYIANEQRRTAEARVLAENALAIQPRSGQAVHTLAHCDYEDGRHEEGRGRLGEWMRGYDRNGAHWTHFVWHLSLFDLELGDLDSAFRRADSGAVSLETSSFLWRCALQGVPVLPERWSAGTRAVRDALGRPGSMTRLNLGFAALGVAGAGDQALGQALIDYARQGNNSPAELALVEGVIAFGRGDLETAISRFDESMPELEDLGGSYLQRKVFLDTLAAARARRTARI